MKKSMPHGRPCTSRQSPSDGRLQKLNCAVGQTATRWFQCYYSSLVCDHSYPVPIHRGSYGTVPASVPGAKDKVAMVLSLLRCTLARSMAPMRAILPFSSPLNTLSRSMKVVSSLKKRCESCIIVKRGTISYVYCSANPRHKARNGPKRRRNNK